MSPSFCAACWRCSATVYALAVSPAEALSNATGRAASRRASQAALGAPNKGDVPKRIRTAVQRAIATDPRKRYASIEPLLQDCSPIGSDRARSAPRANAFAISERSLYSWAPGRTDGRPAWPPATRCQRWTPDAKRPVREAFTAPDRPAYPTALGDRVLQRLDLYATNLTGNLLETCRASVVRKELPPEGAEARRDCPSGRAGELTSLVDHPRGVIGDVLDGAVFDIADSRPSKSAWIPRRAALLTPAPSEPARRDTVRAIRAQLAEVEQQALLGHYEQGAGLAQAALANARTAGVSAAQRPRRNTSPRRDRESRLARCCGG